jgi:FkbM family methyltransferase
MDVGANVGIFTAYCAANGAIVNAYEPSPEAFSELCNMLQMSRLGHCVLAHPEAIWTHRDIIPYSGNKTSMENCEWYNGAVLVAGINPSEFAYKGTVPCISFEDALRDIEWDMVTMDIEGAEFEVLLNTPERALRRIKFLFVEFHPWVSNGLYADVISKLQHVFNFEGYYSEKLARWEAAYCRKR